MSIKIGEEMKPDRALKSLYYTYLFAAALVFFVICFLPVMLFAPLFVVFMLGLFLGIPALVVFVALLIWIPKYYDTIRYRLNSSEIVWKRGVWFRKTGVVPYNRITNVDIDQGPVSRALGIASIKIQTAGYSSPNARTSEIRIDGMRSFEEIRDAIIVYVRGQKPVAVETYQKEEPSDMLTELVKIRKLLEKRRTGKR